MFFRLCVRAPRMAMVRLGITECKRCGSAGSSRLYPDAVPLVEVVAAEPGPQLFYDVGRKDSVRGGRIAPHLPYRARAGNRRGYGLIREHEPQRAFGSTPSGAANDRSHFVNAFHGFMDALRRQEVLA